MCETKQSTNKTMHKTIEMIADGSTGIVLFCTALWFDIEDMNQ